MRSWLRSVVVVWVLLWPACRMSADHVGNGVMWRLGRLLRGPLGGRRVLKVQQNTTIEHRPTTAQPSNTESGEMTRRKTSGYTSAGCSAKEPTANKPTVSRLTQPCTNDPAAETTTRLSTDHTQAAQHETNQACRGRNGNGVQRVGDTMVRHARRRPYPQTPQNTANLPLRNRPTNINELLRTPRPPGERKLDQVRRREHVSRHASPVARASSSRLTPTENQPT